MNEKDSSLFFQQFKDKLTDYADLKLEYYKLSSYEVIGKVAGRLSYGLILIIISLWAILFFLLAAGFLLGDLLNSRGLGLLCVALILLLLLGIAYFSRNWIREAIINKCLKGITTLETELENGYKDTDDSTTDTVGEVMLTEERTEVPD